MLPAQVRGMPITGAGAGGRGTGAAERAAQESMGVLRASLPCSGGGAFGQDRRPAYCASARGSPVPRAVARRTGARTETGCRASRAHEHPRPYPSAALNAAAEQERVARETPSMLPRAADRHARETLAVPGRAFGASDQGGSCNRQMPTRTEAVANDRCAPRSGAVSRQVDNVTVPTPLAALRFR